MANNESSSGREALAATPCLGPLSKSGRVPNVLADGGQVLRVVASHLQEVVGAELNVGGQARGRQLHGVVQAVDVLFDLLHSPPGDARAVDGNEAVPL